MLINSKARERTRASPPELSEDTATCVPDLPQEVLCQVLQHVDVKQRLSTCALVCQAWQHAAQAVTTGVSVRINRDVQNSFAVWLNSHGSRLEHLSIDSSMPRDWGRVVLHFHNLCALTALTRLQLSSVEADFRELHKCTMLQHLQLDWVEQYLPRAAVEDISEQMFQDALTSALQGLVQLTHVTLRVGCSVETLQHLSCLQHLQHLVLCVEQLPLKVLAHTGLASLTRLEIDAEFAEDIGEEGESALLAMVSSLQQLQHLDLQCILRHELVDTTKYAALTAAAQITYLRFEDCFLPDAAWQHLFPLGKQLLQLQHLIGSAYVFRQAGSFQRLVSCCPNLRQLKIVEDAETARVPRYIYSGSAAADAGGVLRLSQLTGLTALTLGSLEIPDQVAAEVAGVTQLKRLQIVHAHDMSGCAVSSLTSLRNLEYLRIITKDALYRVYSWQKYDEDSAEDKVVDCGSFGPISHRYILRNLAPPGCEPDVSRQLEELCKRFEHKWTASPTSSRDL